MELKTATLPILTLLCVGVLSACSSDSSSDPLHDPANLPPIGNEGEPIGVFNPDATTDVFACESRYYTELRGSYVGEVSQTLPSNPENSCTWSATLQVRGANSSQGDTSTCTVSATYSYTLTDGGASCVDGSLEANLIDPFASSSSRLDWENPVWPIDLPMMLEPSVADDAIVPAGTIAGDAREVMWRFDGFGEAFLIDNNETDGIAAGTLLKF